MTPLLAPNLKDKTLCKVRTVTTFIDLNKESKQWQHILADAIAHCERLADALTHQGYIVQSIRIVTNPFGDYLNTDSVAAASKDLVKITQILNKLSQGALRIRFAIGEARTAQEIALFPELIRDFGDLCNACVNISTNALGVLDNDRITQCVQTVQRISQITPRGEGNFNFTVNFNCSPYIPYFPASYHHGRTNKGETNKAQVSKGFVVGLETPDLLVAALDEVNSQLDITSLSYQERQGLRFKAMSQALQYHIDAVQGCINTANAATDWQYLGMDTSAAPSKDCTSMVEIYKRLGVPYLGAAGTLEASALLTRVFKSIERVNAVGFSGLMLAVTEDTGLAEATINDEFDIRALLTYSAVCGIGLDTVPIPGDTPAEKMAALMRDTGTMAYRLNKPLTVRVFPVPGLEAGEMTAFESADLCNCAVLAVP